MPAAKVLEAQADLITKFKNEDFRIYTAHFLYATTSGTRFGVHRTTHEKMDRAAKLTYEIADLVGRAEAFHVSAEMTQVIQYAAEGLDETDVTDTSLAPALNGIVRFDGGICVAVGDAETWIDWIIWQAGAHGVTYLMVIDAVDRPGEAAITARAISVSPKMFGRWRWAQIVQRPNGLALGGPKLDEYVSVEIVGFDDVDSTSVERPTTNTARLLHAFWLMLNQQITVVSAQRPHSSARPGLKKARLPKDVKVTVVELRRHHYPNRPKEAEGAAVEWSHRWIVRGFWRWQAHGEARAQRKRIWIDSYIKGPGNKPLVVSNRVFDLRR
jgi:hypothetical protein